jgi:hypothetical protein
MSIAQGAIPVVNGMPTAARGFAKALEQAAFARYLPRAGLAETVAQLALTVAVTFVVPIIFARPFWVAPSWVSLAPPAETAVPGLVPTRERACLRVSLWMAVCPSVKSARSGLTVVLNHVFWTQP